MLKSFWNQVALCVCGVLVLSACETAVDPQSSTEIGNPIIVAINNPTGQATSYSRAYYIPKDTTQEIVAYLGDSVITLSKDYQEGYLQIETGQGALLIDLEKQSLEDSLKVDPWLSVKGVNPKSDSVIGVLNSTWNAQIHADGQWELKIPQGDYQIYANDKSQAQNVTVIESIEGLSLTGCGKDLSKFQPFDSLVYEPFSISELAKIKGYTQSGATTVGITTSAESHSTNIYDGQFMTFVDLSLEPQEVWVESDKGEGECLYMTYKPSPDSIMKLNLVVFESVDQGTWSMLEGEYNFEDFKARLQFSGKLLQAAMESLVKEANGKVMTFELHRDANYEIEVHKVVLNATTAELQAIPTQSELFSTYILPELEAIQVNPADIFLSIGAFSEYVSSNFSPSLATGFQQGFLVDPSQIWTLPNNLQEFESRMHDYRVPSSLGLPDFSSEQPSSVRSNMVEFLGTTLAALNWSMVGGILLKNDKPTYLNQDGQYSLGEELAIHDKDILALKDLVEISFDNAGSLYARGWIRPIHPIK